MRPSPASDSYSGKTVNKHYDKSPMNLYQIYFMGKPCEYIAAETMREAPVIQQPGEKQAHQYAMISPKEAQR